MSFIYPSSSLIFMSSCLHYWMLMSGIHLLLAILRWMGSACITVHLKT